MFQLITSALAANKYELVYAQAVILALLLQKLPNPHLSFNVCETWHNSIEEWISQNFNLKQLINILKGNMAQIIFV